MNNLKAELRGETMPDFTLSLPVGWVRREPDDDTRKSMVAEARARLMSLHRPDLYAQLTAMTDRMFRDMQRVEAVAFYLPDAGAPDSAFLPASLTASVRRASDGASLDETMTHLIRSQGATPLGADKRFLRWVQRDRQTLDDTTVDTTTIVYLTPVPNTGRRRALQFTLVISHDSTADGDEGFVAGLEDLFDSHLATFSWVSE